MIEEHYYIIMIDHDDFHVAFEKKNIFLDFITKLKWFI